MSAEEYYRRERELKQFHRPQTTVGEPWYEDNVIIRERHFKNKRAGSGWAKILRSIWQIVK